MWRNEINLNERRWRYINSYIKIKWGPLARFEGGKDENVVGRLRTLLYSFGFNTANGLMSMWKGISGYTTRPRIRVQWGTYIYLLHPLGCGTITTMCQPLSPPHVSITFVTHYSSAWKAFETTTQQPLNCGLCESVYISPLISLRLIRLPPHHLCGFWAVYYIHTQESRRICGGLLLETVEIIGLNRLAPAKRRERERERPTDANLISIMHSAVSEFRG